ncbi:winged helix-turn-helix domain-containing protein [Colwellia piezophila]|uniref:winged helix-turn-helix domain-containing protein n=1 Tax=Colwellia piezophila TaxID=211668 RepID=UPI000371A76A|nr:winged helix-turn-helix domain-containing protein [Colwellia piezophila]
MIKLPFQKYQIGQCIINCHDMTVTVGKESTQLPAKVFEFLKLLIAHPNQTVTKEQAIEAIWLGNIEVGKRGVGNAIWHLRKTMTQLGVNQDDMFKTITKVGYQLLIEPVPIIEKSAPHPILSATSKPTNKLLFFLAAICTVMIALVFSFYLYINQISGSDSDVKTPQIQIQHLTNFEGVEERPSISEDGHYMAFQWLQQNQNSQIFIKDLVNLESPLRQISMTAEKEVSPTWSPDAQSLAYFRVSQTGECSLHVRELITNQDKFLDKNCVSKGYFHSIDWSPDGKKIAYSKQLSDRVAIVTFDMSSKNIEQYTFPNAGEEDLLMSWSADSSQLAFVRSVELDAKILLTDNLKQERLLIDNEKMILSLDWHKKDNVIYFNGMRDADFVIQKYDVSSQSIKDVHIDNTIYSLALNEANNELIYVRHIAQEHITIRSLNDGHIIRQLVSSSRDLYGQFVAKTGDILFLSNRSGAWEVWLKHESNSTQITDNQGQVTIPVVSPIDTSFVIALKTDRADNYTLYKGSLPEGELVKLIDIDGDVRNPSYSPDGERLYFSSNKTGQWAIYRYDFAIKKITQIIDDNGKYAIESNDGGIYYTKENVAGIFYLSKDKKTQKTVTPHLNALDWGSFFIQNKQLYYLKRTKENDILMRIDSAGNEQEVFSLPPISIRNEKALTPAYLGTVIVSMLGINDADIYSIPLK